MWALRDPYGGFGSLLGLLTALAGPVVAAPPAPRAAPPLEAYLAYPFASELTAASRGGAVAWVRMVRGVRNLWLARGPDWTARQVTANTADDGQEITGLAFSPDGRTLAFVVGGDHDANWPAEGGLAPDPASDPQQPAVTIWASLDSAAPVRIAEGDAPAVSARGVLAFLKDGAVWTAPLDGKGKAERLFFDRGKTDYLTWSPDGARLAYVSRRGDHAFIGVWSGPGRPIVYLAPSTGRDDQPRWSADGRRIAFVRRPGEGGPPASLLHDAPQPWAIEIAAADGGPAREVWTSPATTDGSLPEDPGEANLGWAGADTLTFLAETGDWRRLYGVAAAGGPARLLTPGDYMVEHVARTADGAILVYDANTGADRLDTERRHVFAVPAAGGAPAPVTAGEGVEVWPVAADGGRVAFLAAGATAPFTAALASLDGTGRRTLGPDAADYPQSALVTPRDMVFQAADGVSLHGQLFENRLGWSGKAAPRPGLIFVHGGPPRQMLLGWHYMDSYAHAYAMNQYYAAHGYVVLSVNYRLGIGYGRAFRHPDRAGPRGASEYQDVRAAARVLQALPEVDPQRIGIWGGSYGGFLTALALARDSATFKAGVDLHGVHDWSATLGRELPPPPAGYEKGDRDAAMETAFRASPVFDLTRWTSPVLLIQGDDDRNVGFHETVDLSRRLRDRGVAVEELVLPNEIHGFLRWRSWGDADAAAADFFRRRLGGR
jgi:dipeptidyl aminopeptidase/acylaminoacyl peptidase